MIDGIHFEQSDMAEYTLMLHGDMRVSTPLGDAEERDEKVVARMTQSEAYELWQALDRVIGSHYREGQRAADEWARGHHPSVVDPDYPDGYDPNDPKSHGYHERMSAIWDEREGK